MNPINRSIYAYRGDVCIHQLLGQKMAAPLEKSCSSWIRNKKRDWIVIIIIIKRFSRYGEPVVCPPVQCMENSQNCCVAPCWEAATSVVFMVEELRGGGSALLRCRQTGFGGTKGVPPFLSWCCNAAGGVWVSCSSGQCPSRHTPDGAVEMTLMGSSHSLSSGTSAGRAADLLWPCTDQ